MNFIANSPAPKALPSLWLTRGWSLSYTLIITNQNIITQHALTLKNECATFIHPL